MEMMRVEIWADIRCPFCYLGKKRFEAALEQFPDKEHVKVEWRSFQLDPYLVTQPGKSIFDDLAEQKGISREQSVQAHEQIVIQARNLGIEFNFDKVVVANSFNAHRLTHLAKTFDLENTMVERLFKAYFIEGENIDDIDTLIKLGTEIGLAPDVVATMITSEDYTGNVMMDEEYARELGIMGVPYFLFHEKLSVRGAQPPETFIRALLKSWEIMSEPVSMGEKARKYIFRKL